MITAYLIDDEPAAGRLLQSLLRDRHPEVDVLGVASTVQAAVECIEARKPDLLFLDINLPDGRGFEVLRHLPVERRPEVIFVTSEASYALQAIKVAALGYLVKPVDPDELAATLTTAKVRIRQRNSEERLRTLLGNLDQADRKNQRIGIPSEQGVEFVDAVDIIYCKGVDGYTSIVLQDGSRRLSSYSIGEYRKMLESMDFFGVHRSFLVNKQHVSGWADGATLLLSNRDRISVSRRRKGAVTDWLAA